MIAQGSLPESQLPNLVESRIKNAQIIRKSVKLGDTNVEYKLSF